MSYAMRVVVGGLFLAALLATRPAFAQTAYRNTSVLDDSLVRSQAKEGLDLLYNMQFDKAANIFSKIDRRYPKHPVGPFLKALNTWWQILMDLQETEHDEAFYAAMEEVIDRSDRLLDRDEDNLDAMFFKGAALGFRGRLRSNRGQWFRAAMDGKRAMDYVLEVAERRPENDDYVFGKGIYDYYAAVIPDRYPYVKPVMIFFPDGNRQRGLAELERTAEEGYFIQTEAAYFLLQIYYLFEKDYRKSVKYATWLRREHPNNAYFHTYEARMYARFGHWKHSHDIFKRVLVRYQKGKTGYNDAAARQALYYIGRYELTQGQYEQALDTLGELERLAAKEDEDTYFKVLGQLRQGMAHDAMGHRSLARARYRAVLGMKDWAGAHERARRYLDAPYEG